GVGRRGRPRWRCAGAMVAGKEWRAFGLRRGIAGILESGGGAYRSRVLLMTSAKLQCRNSAARRDSIMRGRKISKYSMIGATSVSTESSSVISFSFRLTLISEAVAA